MRYPANFVQTMPADDLARLPKWCTYEGDAPDLKHLLNLVFETKTIESLVYVGERENIVVQDVVTGERTRPWKFVEIVELDASGKPVVSGYTNADPIPKRKADAMSRADLASLGMTDADLIDLAKTELGEVYKPDRAGPSDLRRSIFDRVMARVHG